MLLIGLGVGVDYALFIVTRHRQGLVAGRDVESSIVNAVNTSGRAVLFAGIIVCIALLGMFALGVSFLYGLAVAAAIGVALTMVAALTLLPAMLGFIGPKVMSRKQKRNLAENGPRIVGGGQQGVLAQLGRPGAAAAVAVGRAWRWSSSSSSPCPSSRSGSGRRTRATTRRARPPGWPSTLLSRVSGPASTAAEAGRSGAARPAGRHRHRRPRRGPAAGRGPRSAEPIYIPSKTGTGDVVLVNVVPRLGTPGRRPRPTSSTISAPTTIPQAVAGLRRQRPVGGTTAIYIDFANVLSLQAPALHRAGGAAVLPSARWSVFRSFVIPLTAAVHEPAVHRGRLRHAGGGLPMGLTWAG